MENRLSEGTPESRPGLQDFIPNCLDWLALMLNSFFRSDNLDRDRFKLFYLPMEDGRSIQIVAYYYDDVDREYIMEKVNLAKNLVYVLADSYRWDWVNIEIDILSIDTDDTITFIRR